MVLQWFQSYLAGRRQYVLTGSSPSSLTLIVCGVLQGLVLGPVLFLFYTANLIPLIQNYGLCPHLYADDAQIYGSSQSFVSPAVLTTSPAGCSQISSNWILQRLRFCGLLLVDILISASRHFELATTKLCQLPSSMTSVSISVPTLQWGHMWWRLFLAALLYCDSCRASTDISPDPCCSH